MRNSEKLKWMSDTDLIDQLASAPGNSPNRKIKVAVTEQDCKDANPGRPLSCAISLAVRRAFPTATYACTRRNRMTITIAHRYLHFEVNDKSDRFIDRLDQLLEPDPTTLHFQLIDVRKVPRQSPERKAQINAARRKRAEEGRPDQTYRSDPLRMRTTKTAKEKARVELRAAIEKAKRDAEAA
jgi:hypothetical protein